MTNNVGKLRKKHLNFINSLPIDEDVKNEATQYLLLLEKSKNEAGKVDYLFDDAPDQKTSLFLRRSFLWAYSKQDASFWVYIIKNVEAQEEFNEQKIS
jgi:hypothetical protein